MNDDQDQPSGKLPAVPMLYAEPIHIDQLGPEEINAILLEMRELARLGKSEPARVTAAKLVLQRLSPKEDLEQKRREAEERKDAIAEARCLMAEFAASKLAGLHQPPALDQNGPPAIIDAAGPAEEMAGMAHHGGQGMGQDA